MKKLKAKSHRKVYKSFLWKISLEFLSFSNYLKINYNFVSQKNLKRNNFEEQPSILYLSWNYFKSEVIASMSCIIDNFLFFYLISVLGNEIVHLFENFQVWKRMYRILILYVRKTFILHHFLHILSMILVIYCKIKKKSQF